MTADAVPSDDVFNFGDHFYDDPNEGLREALTANMKKALSLARRLVHSRGDKERLRRARVGVCQVERSKSDGIEVKIFGRERRNVSQRNEALRAIGRAIIAITGVTAFCLRSIWINPSPAVQDAQTIKLDVILEVSVEGKYPFRPARSDYPTYHPRARKHHFEYSFSFPPLTGQPHNQPDAPPDPTRDQRTFSRTSFTFDSIPPGCDVSDSTVGRDPSRRREDDEHCFGVDCLSGGLQALGRSIIEVVASTMCPDRSQEAVHL